MEGDLIGRLVLELYCDLCPRTAHNFVCLCTGHSSAEGEDRSLQSGGAGEGGQGKKLSYVNSLIHRVVPGGWIQGGGKGAGPGAGPDQHSQWTCSVHRYLWRQRRWWNVHIWENI